MKFIKLTLVNIRSYAKQEITFPEGIVLLGGDIGAGKSTILLAIEFAFFGAKSVSPDSLLRHGAQTGMIEMAFELEKQYTIRRVLKRTPETIEQESGFLTIDGVRKEGTATELKSWILEILGYPAELVSKTKSLVYRYTVYTPQEEMKRILFDGPEARLSVLRKVFDIDKYKCISENAQTYARTLRERKRHLEGKISDLDVKRAKLELQKKELQATKSEAEKQQESVVQLQEKHDSLLAETKKHEELVMSFLQKKNELAIHKNAIAIHSKAAEATQYELKKTKETIDTLEKEVLIKKPEQKQEYENTKTALENSEKKLSATLQETTKLNTLQSEHLSIQQKIAALESCPLCMQQVSHEHKKNIISQKQAQLQEIRPQLSKLMEEKKTLEEHIRECKQQLEKIIEHQRQREVQAVKEKMLEEKRKHCQQLNQRQEEEQKQAAFHKEHAESIEKELKLCASAEQEWEKTKKALKEIQEILNNQKILLHKLLTKQDILTAQQKELAREVEEKEREKLQKEMTERKEHWLSEHFVQLMSMMERTIFAKVWNEFNSYFVNWFSMLVEDESIIARLDDSFSPLIEQNGYDTTIENLSGGERTACALAYRLALNKVINNMMTSMKTKDVLILDEPTDGFSSEQLDRLKDVLDALQTKQVIIVSHEKKVEGFADSVIQITKSNHLSSIQTV